MVEEKGTHSYTLIISQYEKNSSIYYTLRVYSSCEFSLTKITDPYKKEYDKKVSYTNKYPHSFSKAVNVLFFLQISIIVRVFLMLNIIANNHTEPCFAKITNLTMGICLLTLPLY